jgi:hypothetical protein
MAKVDDEQARAEREVMTIESPGPVETAEQGAVRTGRALPRHDGVQDSAGLTPAATAARVDHTHAQRNETHRVVEAQGHAADGDTPGGTRS